MLKKLLAVPTVLILALLTLTSSHANGETFYSPQTGHNITGLFALFWESHGDWWAFGYPLTEQFDEKQANGSTLRVQYFERAIFEYHPEIAAPFQIQLRRLGAAEMARIYPNSLPAAAPVAADYGPTNTPRPATATRVPTAPATATAASTATPTVQAAAPTDIPVPTATQGSGGSCEAPTADQQRPISHSSEIEISNVQFSGDEYVELLNDGAQPIDLGGWVLQDANDPAQMYAFKAGSVIAAGGTIQVYTAPGHAYTFGSNRPIWNDCGDALELVDAAGITVATYGYGTYQVP
jgi:hypothetical protein